MARIKIEDLPIPDQTLEKEEMKEVIGGWAGLISYLRARAAQHRGEPTTATASALDICIPTTPLYTPQGSALWAKHSEDTPGLQADIPRRR